MSVQTNYKALLLVRLERLERVERHGPGQGLQGTERVCMAWLSWFDLARVPPTHCLMRPPAPRLMIEALHSRIVLSAKSVYLVLSFFHAFIMCVGDRHHFSKPLYSSTLCVCVCSSVREGGVSKCVFLPVCMV